MKITITPAPAPKPTTKDIDLQIDSSGRVYIPGGPSLIQFNSNGTITRYGSVYGDYGFQLDSNGCIKINPETR